MKLAAIFFLLMPMIAVAQHSPYTGQQSREIKSLSPDEIKQYLAGAGMGYAKPAELNGYPGPMHVLDLADALALTASQRETIGNLMKTHKSEARSIGERVIREERELEKLFRQGNADPAVLKNQVGKAALIQGEYRLSHLETHRQMHALLTPIQIERYNELRGYNAITHEGSGHHSSH